jgi:hypothetical protein
MPHVPRPRVPHVSVPRPSLPHVSAPHLPSRREVVDLGHGVSGFLPPRDQLALYGGLGAAAALGVLDWPVAIAVGAGTAVARRRNGLLAAYAARLPAQVEAPAQAPKRAPRKAAAKKSAAKRTATRRTTAKRTASTAPAAKKSA